MVKLLNNTKGFQKMITQDNSNYLILYKQLPMQIFYAPDISGNDYTLDENESRHCIRVLRMKSGTPVQVNRWERKPVMKL